MQLHSGKVSSVAVLLVLLAACNNSNYTTEAQSSTRVEGSCPVGSTCDDLGGNSDAEDQRLNSGLKPDNSAALEAEAEKIRNQDPEKLEKSIEKMERTE
jgi:hypothetical protein